MSVFKCWLLPNSRYLVDQSCRELNVILHFNCNDIISQDPQLWLVECHLLLFMDTFFGANCQCAEWHYSFFLIKRLISACHWDTVGMFFYLYSLSAHWVSFYTIIFYWNSRHVFFFFFGWRAAIWMFWSQTFINVFTLSAGTQKKQCDFKLL